MQADYRSFAKNTGGVANETNVESGLGFQPDALILWATLNTSDGAVVHFVQSVGFSDGTNHYAMCGTSEDGTGGFSDADRRHALKGLTFLDFARATIAECDVSFQSDGYTLTWTTADTGGYIIHALAIEGVTAEVGFFQTIGATGSQTITTTMTPSEAPGKSALMLLSCGLGSDPPGVTGLIANVIGMATSEDAGVQQAVISYLDRNVLATTDSRRYYSSGDVWAALGGGASEVVGKEADFTAFDDATPGFTIEHTIASGSFHRIGYLLMTADGDGAFRVINDAQPTSAQEQTLSLDSFDPIAGVLMSVSSTVDGTVDTEHCVSSFGGGTAADSGGGIWCGAEDGVVSDTNTAQRTNQAKTFLIKEDVIGTGAVDAEADLLLTYLSAVLDWTTADSTARLFAALLFGNEVHLDYAPGPPLVRDVQGVASYGSM